MADENDTNGGPRLTHSQTVNRQREITSEMQRLGELDAPTPEDLTFFGDLEREFFELDGYRTNLETQHRLARVREVAEGELRDAPARLSRGGAGRGRLELGAGSADNMDSDPVLNPDSIEEHRFRNPWDMSEVRTFDRSQGELVAEYRSRARCAIERMSGATDRIREAATSIIERWDDEDGKLSRLALALSEPVYLRAWSKMARSPLAADLDVDERRAIGRVQQFARAMSLTDANGGYLVPFQLDPTVILTADGSVNQIRQAARTVVATGDVWHGVSSGNVSWSYDGEGMEVSDDSTTFGQPTVPIHKAQGFVPISREAFQDAANVTTEVGRLLAAGKDDLEALKFALGSGSGEPTGIVTALAGTASVVDAATDDTFALGDVYALDGALPAKYHASASAAWLGHRLIYNRIRQFDTAGGAGLFADNLREGMPTALLDHRTLVAESMDGTITSSESNNVLVLGAFENYVIADRIGMTVEFVPHLFGANRRPTNQVGWLAYCRHGADSVNDGAFRMLDV